MKDVVEDPGGDMRAVEGTVAEVAVLTDRPLGQGVLIARRRQANRAGEGRRELVEGEDTGIRRMGMFHVVAHRAWRRRAHQRGFFH